MSIKLIANNNDMEQRLSDVNPDNKQTSLSDADKRALESSLLDLKAYVHVRQKEYESCNKIVLPALNDLTSAARARGLFAFLGMDSNPCVATGKNALSGQWQQTKIGYGGRGQRFSISAPRDDADSLTSRYHVWEVEKWVANRDAGDVVHLRIDPVSLAVSDADAVSPDKFSDVRAVPALNNPNKDACFVYVAHDGGDSAYLRLFELDAHNKMDGRELATSYQIRGGQCSGRDPSAGNASRRSRQGCHAARIATLER